MNQNRDFIKEIKFKDINVNQKFFDTLRADYGEIAFNNWFTKKAEEHAYVIEQDHLIEGFLYLKDENEDIELEDGNLPAEHRLKVGTFKLPSGRGTSLGQRFMRKVLENFVTGLYESVYVTIFPKQEQLINLFEKFGFKKVGIKRNGEGIWLKVNSSEGKLRDLYPKVKLGDERSAYILSVLPEYHTHLFPESMLNTEDLIVEDNSPANTVEKTYLNAMVDTQNLKFGDILIIYRPGPYGSVKKYTSVATTLVTVTDMKNISEMKSFEEFRSFVGKGTIFSNEELRQFWNNKKYPFIIKFLYNFSFPKRVNLVKLREIFESNMEAAPNYWGFSKLSELSLQKILKEGQVNESFIIN